MVFTLMIHAAAAGDEYSHTKELGVAFGYSPVSYDGLIGVVTGQQYYEASLNLGYVFKQNDSHAWKYKVSLIPFALVRGDGETLTLRPSRAVYAGGAEPIGLQLNFRNYRKLQPFVNAAGGFLYFTEQIPVSDSSQYNFTFSFGGGVEILSGRRSFVVAYRFHHISNGYTAARNPGIDSQLLSIGLLFKR